MVYGGIEREKQLEADFDTLAKLLSEMITAPSLLPAEEDAPEWRHSLHELSRKLFKHVCSARVLLDLCKYQIKDSASFGYIDHSSVAVLTRSAIENYLVMYWIFSSGDESLREFRHSVWMYSGLKKRTKIFATGSEALAKQRQAEEIAAELWPSIIESPHFETYRKEDQRRLRKGNWDAGWHWNDLAEAAGFHRGYFTSLYPYFSGYAHSDYISSLQGNQATHIQDQYNLGALGLQVCLVTMGHFIHFYSNLFPVALAILDNAGTVRSVARRWHLRVEDMDFLYRREAAGDQPSSPPNRTD